MHSFIYVEKAEFSSHLLFLLSIRFTSVVAIGCMQRAQGVPFKRQFVRRFEGNRAGLRFGVLDEPTLDLHGRFKLGLKKSAGYHRALTCK